MKQIQWEAFLRKNRLPSEKSESLLDGSIEDYISYFWDKEKWKWVVGSD